MDLPLGLSRPQAARLLVVPKSIPMKYFLLGMANG